MFCLIKLFQKPTPFGSIWCIVFTKIHVTWNSNWYGTYVCLCVKRKVITQENLPQDGSKSSIYFMKHLFNIELPIIPLVNEIILGKNCWRYFQTYKYKEQYTSIINPHVFVPWIPWISLFSNLLSSFHSATFFFPRIDIFWIPILYYFNNVYYLSIR